VLLVLSAAWSVDPRLTVSRALALALVLCAAAALAVSLETGLLRAEALAAALVGAMAVVALAGLVLLAVSPSDGMHPGTGRLNGIGGDANTVSSMLALGVPIALVSALAARGRTRVWWLVALALLVGTIVASGSRGALVSGACGCAVALLVRSVARRQMVVALGLLAVAVVIAAAAMARPIGSADTSALAPTAPTGAVRTGPGRRYINADLTHRLEDDVGAAVPGGAVVDPHRTFLSSSGRGQAWEGALDQAAERATTGYGFGTEPSVFVDRYVAFQGSFVENAYLGLLLQIGIVGLLCLAGGVFVLTRRMRAALPVSRDHVAAFAGVVAAGLVLALTQSFLASAGNVAALTFWTALFAAGTVAGRTTGRAR
jgi:O-antigen ligase